jgi:hypothetical protein
MHSMPRPDCAVKPRRAFPSPLYFATTGRDVIEEGQDLDALLKILVEIVSPEVDEDCAVWESGGRCVAVVLATGQVIRCAGPRLYQPPPAREYGCVHCQRRHDDADPLFTAHLADQDKHGVR